MSAAREGLKLCLLKTVGYIPSQAVRHAAYRACGMTMGRGSVIYHGCEVRAPRAVRIGSWTSIGDHAILDGRGGLTIGDSVNFSTGVWVWTAEHAVNDSAFGYSAAPVVIEDYAWISCRAVVLPGVTVGRGRSSPREPWSRSRLPPTTSWAAFPRSRSAAGPGISITS